MVVPLGLMVTVLWGIARKVASVSTEVLALGAMLLSLRVRLERTRAVCPQCGITLNLLGEYVALNSGVCNSCGGQVIE